MRDYLKSPHSSHTPLPAALPAELLPDVLFGIASELASSAGAAGPGITKSASAAAATARRRRYCVTDGSLSAGSGGLEACSAANLSLRQRQRDDTSK